MRGFGCWLAGLTLLLAACSAPVVPPASPSPTFESPTAGSVSPDTGPSDTPPPGDSPAASPTFCPGRTWPPYPLGGIEGISAVSTDRQTIEIRSRTDRTWYYTVAGWQLDQFETCLAFGEYEVSRGPIDQGTTVRVLVDADWWHLGVPVTVGFWDERCGEACNREPIAALALELSPVVPIAS